MKRPAPGEALLLLAMVLAPWPFGAAPDVARFSLTTLLLVGAALHFATRSQGLPRAVLPALALVALGLAQVALGSSVGPVNTIEASLVLMGMLAAFLVWADSRGNRGTATVLAAVVVVLCIAQAVFGAVQWSRGSAEIYGLTGGHVTAPFGSFVNHNHFAGLMEMGCLLTAGMALGLSGSRRALTPAVIGLGGASFFFAAAHLASGSRGGLVALGCGALVLGFGWTRTGRRAASARRRPLWVLLGVFALIGFGLSVIPSATRARLATVLEGGAGGSRSYRIEIARATLRLAAERPLLGAGLGAYADAVPAHKQAHGNVRVTHAESDVLEMVAEGGVVGLALAVWLGFSVVSSGAGWLSRGRDPLRRGITLGALAAVGALLVHSLFDFNLRIPSNALVFASLCGLLASRPEADRVGGRGASLLLASVLLLAGGAAASRAHGTWELSRVPTGDDQTGRMAALDGLLGRHPYLAEAHRARGLLWRDLARCGERCRARRLARAQRDLEAALTLRPRWAAVWAELGWIRYLAGDAAAGESHLDRARDLDPTHLSVGVARAHFHVAQGDVASAIDELARLLEVNPHWPPTQAQALARGWTEDPRLLGRLD